MYSEMLYNQCKESDMWLLIQLPETGYNSDIIHSSDVIQKDKMQNGQTIDVKYGDSLLKAEIYTISDDKKFLEYEMHILNELRATESHEKQNQKPSVCKRRRRLTQSRLEPRIKYKPNSSISGLPSPTWSNSTNESMISNVENQTTVVMQPIKLEQGTQTDIKLTSDGESTQSKHLSKLVQRFESFILQNRQTQKIMFDDIKEIKQKLNHNDNSHMNPQIINSQTKANTEPIVLFTESSNHIANFNTAQINNNVYDKNKANISYSTQNYGASNNIMATNELCFNSIPMYQGHESFSAGKENHTKSSFRNNAKYNCSEIVIGPYGSTVPKINIDNISSFTSYSYATRKLLNLFFTKEVLASHSLSGRPSPAHTSKPVKDQLNSFVVADIVQFVTQQFGVAEKDVRAVITTKCSDEHRMLEKKKFKKRNSNNSCVKAGSED